MEGLHLTRKYFPIICRSSPHGAMQSSHPAYSSRTAPS
nr:MAG TPA: hypothetical protein [Caudoviricetes sp.]